MNIIHHTSSHNDFVYHGTTWTSMEHKIPWLQHLSLLPVGFLQVRADFLHLEAQVKGLKEERFQVHVGISGDPWNFTQIPYEWYDDGWICLGSMVKQNETDHLREHVYINVYENMRKHTLGMQMQMQSFAIFTFFFFDIKWQAVQVKPVLQLLRQQHRFLKLGALVPRRHRQMVGVCTTSTLWLWLTVRHGKIHHAIKNGKPSISMGHRKTMANC